MSPFAIKTTGGPLDSQVRMCDDPAHFGMTWPFPDVLDLVPGGRYVKVCESQLPAEAAANPHVALGAEYEWEPSP